MRKIGLQALGFVVAGLMLWGVLAWRDRETLKRFQREAGISKRDTVIQVLDSTRFIRDTLYLRGKTTHAAVVGNPASTKADVINSCQQLIIKCDALRAINDTLRDSLKTQITDLKKLKALKPARFSSYAEGLYDVLNREPVVRAGGEMRLLGPLSLSVSGETSAGMKESQQRVLVGARFTFR